MARALMSKGPSKLMVPPVTFTPGPCRQAGDGVTPSKFETYRGRCSRQGMYSASVCTCAIGTVFTRCRCRFRFTSSAVHPLQRATNLQTPAHAHTHTHNCFTHTVTCFFETKLISGVRKKGIPNLKAHHQIMFLICHCLKFMLAAKQSKARLGGLRQAEAVAVAVRL